MSCDAAERSFWVINRCNERYVSNKIYLSSSGRNAFIILHIYLGPEYYASETRSLAFYALLSCCSVRSLRYTPSYYIFEPVPSDKHNHRLHRSTSSRYRCCRRFIFPPLLFQPITPSLQTLNIIPQELWTNTIVLLVSYFRIRSNVQRPLSSTSPELP